MKLTNTEIYNYAVALNRELANCMTMTLPVKVGFFLQKNKKIIVEAAQEIDAARIDLIQKYGTPAENGEYNIPLENREIFQNEMNELFNLEQELNIHTFKLDDFATMEQIPFSLMEAIEFMIEE